MSESYNRGTRAVLPADTVHCDLLDLVLLFSDCLVDLRSHTGVQPKVQHASYANVPVRNHVTRSEETWRHEDCRRDVQEALCRPTDGPGWDFLRSCILDNRTDGSRLGDVHFDDWEDNLIHQRGHLVLVPAAFRYDNSKIRAACSKQVSDVQKVVLHELCRLLLLPNFHRADRLPTRDFWMTP